MKKFGFFLTVALLSFAAMLAFTYPTIASSTGRVGRSGNPATGAATCAQCHSGGTAPTVTLQGSATVFAGSVLPYSLTIAGGELTDAANDDPRGGFNVSTDFGDLLLATGSDTQLQSVFETGKDEVTHTLPHLPNENGEIKFDFVLSIPATTAPGTYTMYGAGNSVDGNGSPFGDGVANRNDADYRSGPRI